MHRCNGKDTPMKGHDFLLSPLYLQACRLALAVAAIAAMTGTAFGAVTLTNVTSEDHTNVTLADHGSSGSGGAMRNEGSSTLVDYSADTLPPPPWEFISNGPPQERSQHTVFVQGGVLHMIDNARLVGNTLGFLQFVPFDPEQVIEVEFRTRVLSGESALDERAPFDVWLYNGTVRADLSVGPQSITALGHQAGRTILILNEPIDGTDWHVYRYRLDPGGIQWWVDGISVGSATTEMLIPAVASETSRRINMFITSASANVELDYLIVKQSPQPRLAQCGGNVPCECGDTVVADYTFTHNLACTLHGFEAALPIGNGVMVNGQGFGIFGTGDGIGILFDGVQGSQVSGLHVTNFATGVRLRAAASGNVYRDAWVWNHAQQGIHLEQSAHRNWIWSVYSLLNGASGMRLEDVSENILAYNIAWSNPISLHMIRADQNTVWFNGWYGDRGHAVVLDESHGNSFYRNDIVCSGGGAVILHQSFDNTAHENTVQCPVFTDQAMATR
jgi:hypothetical protein